jgi:hypothetical protein
LGEPTSLPAEAAQAGAQNEPAAPPEAPKLTAEEPRRAGEEEAYGPRENKLILNINGAYSFVDNQLADQNSISGQLGVGYFITANHEAGLQVFGQWSRIKHFGSTHLYFLGPYYNYNHQVTPRTGLYAGPHLGYSSLGSSSDDEDQFSYGAHVGVRHWLTPAVNLNIEPRFTHSEFDRDIGGVQNNWDFLFGFGVLF